MGSIRARQYNRKNWICGRQPRPVWKVSFASVGDFRDGSKAAVYSKGDDFCFTPQSRHAAALRQLTQWAKTRHSVACRVYARPRARSITVSGIPGAHCLRLWRALAESNDRNLSRLLSREARARTVSG